MNEPGCEFEGTLGFDATGVLALTPVFGFSRDVSISGGAIRPFRVVRQMQSVLAVDDLRVYRWMPWSPTPGGLPVTFNSSASQCNGTQCNGTRTR